MHFLIFVGSLVILNEAEERVPLDGGYSHSGTPFSEIPVEVQLKLGAVQGRETMMLGKRVRSFLSVPFAEKPLGKDRFKPPKVKKSWNGTLDATVLAPSCYQGRDSYNESFWGSEMWNANTPMTEDCLYLNIWAPADASNLTVMVWIFGGGFWYGSPSLLLYDGRALAVTGNIVVVNINYRLGPLGYLYLNHDDVPGNVGMIDQQMAMYWVKDNIFNFGGNPSRITLFGESAGASSIVAHLIAPASRDLFSNGILQSGSLDNRWAMDTPERALDKSLQMVRLVGCNRTKVDDTIACLQDVPAQTLIDNIWNLDLAFLEFPFVLVSRDENFFKHKDAFIALREGDFRKDVNIMIGINHDEGNFWNIYNLAEWFDKNVQPIINRDEFHSCIERAFAKQPSLVRYGARHVYSDPNCTDPAIPNQFYAEQVNQMVGDYFFTCDSLWLADKISLSREEHHGRVYIYYFDQASSANPWPAWTGVMHAYEIEFVFGVPLHNETAGYTAREKKFSEKIIQYWSSFSTNGFPRLRDAKSHDHWPSYHGTTRRKWMYLKGGSHIKPIEARKKVECDLWRNAKDIEYRAYVSTITSSTAPPGRSSFLLSTLFVLLVAAVETFQLLKFFAF